MRRWTSRFRADERGAAAVEMGLIGSMLLVGLLNAIDVGRYAFETAEVNAAAQAGAQAAYVACDPEHTPATLKCPDLEDRVTAAIQATRLGADITIETPITEAYYCLDKNRELQRVAAASSKPINCSALASATAGATPTLYLQVEVSHQFEPLFPGMTLANTFSPAIVRTSWMRMA
ncbi:TadE/TadG family type IV pilus assembly protein [Phenylobacterium sp. LjRoot219]|uniref:TadE/TadG family type IV pilus assembly protein n=1 Tax=Phenylobacterium sp. LjRoot219 TaxID=3342283 RepID=UPI003ED1137F